VLSTLTCASNIQRYGGQAIVARVNTRAEFLETSEKFGELSFSLEFVFLCD
jgi:hypothetical protein